MFDALGRWIPGLIPRPVFLAVPPWAAAAGAALVVLFGLFVLIRVLLGLAHYMLTFTRYLRSFGPRTVRLGSWCASAPRAAAPGRGACVVHFRRLVEKRACGRSGCALECAARLSSPRVPFMPGRRWHALTRCRRHGRGVLRDGACLRRPRRLQPAVSMLRRSLRCC